MKIYKIRFKYFDGDEHIVKEILANSLFQLMKTFLKETQYMVWICLGEYIRGYEAQKELFKFYKKNIEEIKFPLVIEK